jgi:hypothetical protein
MASCDLLCVRQIWANLHIPLAALHPTPPRPTSATCDASAEHRLWIWLSSVALLTKSGSRRNGTQHDG